MAIPEDRMSTLPAPGDYLTPDDISHTSLIDYEAGPLAFGNTSLGSFYQTWLMRYVGDDLVVVPQTTGSAVTALTVSGVTKATFAFDQNANITISYFKAGIHNLYWFDSSVNQYITSQPATNVVSSAVTLDDKRKTQTNSSDILLFYTKLNPDGVSYALYQRKQRQRYGTEKLMKAFAPPYITKLGMNNGLRVQISMSTVIN